MGRHNTDVSSEDHFLLTWGGEKIVTHTTFTSQRFDPDTILAHVYATQETTTPFLSLSLPLSLSLSNIKRKELFLNLPLSTLILREYIEREERERER